jgi:hypothetical protein
MNHPWDCAQSARSFGTGYQETWQVHDVGDVRVLFVGPQRAGDVVYDELAEGLNSALLASDHSKLSLYPIQEPIRLAVLHHRLSSYQLEYATRTIRHRWPRARILVLREGEDFLDDALYDDRLVPPTCPGVVLSTIQHLLRRLRD